MVQIGTPNGTQKTTKSGPKGGSKAAISGMVKSLALELSSRNINVNAVAPGFIASNMTDKLTENQKKTILDKIPMKRLGTPEDIAKTVGFLCSENASYITGQTIHVNGGLLT